MSIHKLEYLFVMILMSLAVVAQGCGDSEMVATNNNDDLTSAGAVERNITINGYVYVSESASVYTIQSDVKRQIRTAFGPLRLAKMSVDDRELKSNVDPSKFVITSMPVYRNGDTGTDLTEGGVNATGVLKLANDAATTKQVLIDEAGLIEQVAQAIIDGRPHDTLAALDGIDGVDQTAMLKLLTVAKGRGHVEGYSTEPVLLKTIKKVSYAYRARALVDKGDASKSSVSIALLMGNYQSFVDDIIHDCVEDYEHDHEFSSSFWYVFAPNEYKCKQRINEEAEQIDNEQQFLEPGTIGEKEVNRRFLPVNAQLEVVGPPKTTYPEYHRLFGVDDPGKDRIKVYQIVGVASHDGDPPEQIEANDMGFKEFFKTIKVLDDQWPHMRVAASSECDPLSFAFNNKTYTAESFSQLYSWTVDACCFPSDVTSQEDKDAFRKAIHDHIDKKWITLEVPIRVDAGHLSKRMILEINLLFGTDSSYWVRNYFKKAFKDGDIVLYDGHSYIGAGPLDPNNYSYADFASKYQILFFNSCVSFNYYGKDYFDMKDGGSQDMDLVTNGLGVWIYDGGRSMGQFIVALLDGEKHTWLRVLEKTRIWGWSGYHDPNRAVDGELDNTYDPNGKPFTVTTVSLDVENTTASCGHTVSDTITLTANSPQASRVEFWVNDTQVAADEEAPFSVSWDTNSVPDGHVTLVIKAYNSQGDSNQDTCTITVKNGTPYQADLFSDDMESGQGGWSATGLWHLAQSNACASPAFATPVSAWYFGQDGTCSFNTGQQVSGTLTTPAIQGISASSTLSFMYYRDVEEYDGGSYDQTRVEVAQQGSETWTAVWSMDSTKTSMSSWTSSGELSLADFAGKTIRVRFVFDSVDDQNNDQVGWLIDDVRVRN